MNHRQKEPYGKSLSKRPRSERRSKTLPNNVFDVFGAFKTSSSTPSSTPESVVSLRLSLFGIVVTFTIRAVIKRQGPGIFPGYYFNVAFGYFQRNDRTKIEPKETPRCLIPCLCVVLTRQLEILVTTLTTMLYYSKVIHAVFV